MLTVPNFISLLRFPLALLFLQENLLCRATAVILAGITDFLDGYLARYYKQTSQLGTILDPLSDKFFVLFSLGIFITEGHIGRYEVCAMLCRDFAVVLFGVYLLASGSFRNYSFRSIWCGKITTALQLTVLLGLTFGVAIPSFLYLTFILLGIAALGELYLSDHKLNPLKQ